MSTWNAETAEWYAAKYGEYATNRLAADAVDVAADAVIVDVGCGTGSALRRVAPRVPAGALIGVDPLPRMLEIARERAAQDPSGHRIEFREGPAEHLPLDDSSADIVFAFDSIDHWQDRAAGLREVCRVLRPGGRLVVVKDGGVPGGTAAKRAFLAELARSGLVVMREEDLAEGDVSCTMWVCGAV
ncbi:MAG: class I SAM-dependent methyltransferase [Myxococcales bacterium]|nr:class I SAM-dependent methyltransferase [Myxococcales bacterium]